MMSSGIPGKYRVLSKHCSEMLILVCVSTTIRSIGFIDTNILTTSNNIPLSIAI